MRKRILYVCLLIVAVLIVIFIGYNKKYKTVQQELLKSNIILKNQEKEIQNLLLVLLEGKTSFKHIYSTLSKYNIEFDIEADTSMKCKNIQMESIRFLFDGNCMLEKIYVKDSIVSKSTKNIVEESEEI